MSLLRVGMDLDLEIEIVKKEIQNLQERLEILELKRKSSLAQQDKQKSSHSSYALVTPSCFTAQDLNVQKSTIPSKDMVKQVRMDHTSYESSSQGRINLARQVLSNQKILADQGIKAQKSDVQILNKAKSSKEFSKEFSHAEKTDSDTGAVKLSDTDSSNESSQDERKAIRKPKKKETYYCVYNGPHAGIYGQWHEAARAIQGIDGVIHKKFHSGIEAEGSLAAYKSKKLSPNQYLKTLMKETTAKAKMENIGIKFSSSEDIQNISFEQWCISNNIIRV